MGLKEIPQINSRLEFLSDFISHLEWRKFDTSEFYSYLSPETKKFLDPISDQVILCLSCLDQVVRYKEHPNQKLVQKKPETDYQHVCEMEKISFEIEDLDIKSIDFVLVQTLILIHDTPEIITDDVSINHEPEFEPYFQQIKQIEPRVFNPLILKQIKDPEFFDTRKKLRGYFNRYESRNETGQLIDTESHLVKLIDMFQADVFALKNLNNQALYRQEYNSDIPEKLINFTDERIQKQIDQLKIVLDSVSDPGDRSKIFLYFKNQQFSNFSNAEYGFQGLYKKYEPKFDSIR